MSAPAHHALFPGSFDPLTLGHLDLVQRARRLFARVTLGVAVNPGKTCLFSHAERLELARRSIQDLGGVDVVPLTGLVALAAVELGADLIVRGVRSGSDCDYELAMARTNGELCVGLETVLLAPAPQWAHVSSTLVREIALLGGDASRFVPPPVAQALLARRARST